MEDFDLFQMSLIVIRNDFDRYSGLLSSLFRMPLIVVQDDFDGYSE